VAVASFLSRLRPLLRSLTVVLGPPLLLKLALVAVLLPWLQDRGRPGRLLANERLLLHGHQLLQSSLERPLAPALALARRRRLERMQQQLRQVSFHGCYQQSRYELQHLLGWMLQPSIAPDDQPRRFGRQLRVYRRKLEGCRRSDDGRV
jgi:hypothetical protein